MLHDLLCGPIPFMTGMLVGMIGTVHGIFGTRYRTFIETLRRWSAHDEA